MTIYLSPSSQIPRPPEEVKIHSFTAHLYPDGKRVRLRLAFTPFQKPPSADIQVWNQAGELISSVNIIESTNTETSVVVHLRGENTTGTYTAAAQTFYLENMPDPSVGPENRQPAKVVPMDEARTTFTITALA
ncbi:MAG: hypothetical protein DRI56_08205 [Chloroflexota bacterium]|nr:MAG: hypothetical protein DRI56_08205 [Chloroflexota bacterium]